VLNDHLGDAYWRVGRKLEATFQWSHTRDMDPEPQLLADVQKKLAEGLPPPEAPATANNPEDEERAPNVVPMPEDAGEKQGAAEPMIETVSVEPASYTVLPGQSLWSIASEVLGDGARYRELLDRNPELEGDPARIVSGQELRLPAPAE
jgi:nucleoid-associated protein YgaU